jgi:hypothetical protein
MQITMKNQNKVLATKRIQKQKLEQGEWIALPPFGYTLLDVETYHGMARPLIVDEVTGPIVTQIFEMYATGKFTGRQLRKEIEEKTGFIISKSSIHNILLNHFYYGVMRVGGLNYVHQYETLITKKLFDEVQQIRELKRGGTGRLRRRIDYDFLYKGILKCNFCTYSVTAEVQKSIYKYYKCIQAAKHGVSYIEEKEITAQLHSAIETLPMGKEILDMISRASPDRIRILIKSIFSFIKLDGYKKIELEIQPIFTTDPIYALRYLERKISFSKSSIPPEMPNLDVETPKTPEQHILKLCREKSYTADELLQKTNMELLQLQEILFDLQMKELIVEMEPNIWGTITRK